MLRMPVCFPLRLIVLTSVVANLAACVDSGGGGGVDADLDGVAAAVDCNDADPRVSVLQTYFVDEDEDGVGGTATDSVCAATPPTGFSAVSTDCNDTDGSLQTTSDYFVDQDVDGIGTALVASLCIAAAPSGYSDASGDCNDADATVSSVVNYYADSDGDGFGVGAATAICASAPPAGFAAVATDPDDGNPNLTPEDLDGDGVANGLDCAPYDGSVYALSTYYYDYDSDGLGTDETELCQSLPAPEVARYSKVQGDECPWIRNTDVDLDEDGLDDACDALIHFTEDKTFGPGTLWLDRQARVEETEYTDREYRLGSEENPVTLRFEGSTVYFDRCVHWSIQGGSSLIFETRDADDRTVVTFADSYSDCHTRIEGGAATDPEMRNTVQVIGAHMHLGIGALFDGLDTVLFKPAQDVVDGDETITLGASLDAQPGSLSSDRFWREQDYPIFRNSPSTGAAVVVEDQLISVGGLRFIGNAGYPLECRGGTFRQPESAAYVSYRFGFKRSTCQNAVQYSFFQGNGREGPLVDVYDSRDEDPTVQNASEWRNEEIRRPYPNWGTNVVYVKRLDLRDASRGIVWGMAFRPHLRPDPDYIGPAPAPDVVDPASLLRMGTTGPMRTRLSVQSSDFSEIPVLMEGSAQLTFFDESIVGPVIMANLEPTELGEGSYLGINGGILDLVSGPFVVEVSTPEQTDRVGLFLQAATGEDPGHVNLIRWNPGGSRPNAFVQILSDASVDQPILALGTPRTGVDYDSPVNLDSFVQADGVAVEDAVEVVEDGCCRAAEFILR